LKKFIIFFIGLYAAVNLFFLFNHIERSGGIENEILKSQWRTEYIELNNRLKHFSTNSSEALKITERLEKINRKVKGEVKQEKPDEFVRILHEMKIPYGETEPQYELDYKIRETEKAFKQKRLNKNGSLNLNWIERGPGNVAGRARGLIIDPDDITGNTWFVGSVGGGIWKTTDAGINWRNLTPNLPNLAVSTIAMSKSNTNIIYAGTGESMFSVDVINGDGILKSTDKGETWLPLESTVGSLDFNNIARIIVDPLDSDVVIAATTSGRYRLNFANRSGIFKSIDGGVSWYQVYNETEMGIGNRIKKILHIINTPGNFNLLYAGIDEKGVLKSTDAGETWFMSSNGITDVSGRFELAISPLNPSKIFAAAEGNPTSNLFVSIDAGASWVKTVENGSEPDWLSSQGWYDNTITVHPLNDKIVYVGGVTIYKIELLANNQRTTTHLSTGPVHVDHHNLMIINDANGSFRILNANDGGIGVSQLEDQNWSKPTLGMNTSQFYGVDKMPGGSAYVGGMQDNGTWRSPENTSAASLWFYQIGGDGYETSWHFDDPLKIIGGSQYNGFRRSLNGGQSYSNATSGLSDVGSGKAPFISKIGKTNMEPDLLFAVGKQGVWKSTNFGGNWSLTSIPSSTWGSVSSFHDIKVSRANPNIVWAGARMDGSGKIHVSADKGATFTAAPVYNVTTMGGISGLSTHPVDDSTAYVLFSFAHKPKILRTADLGQTWKDLSGFGNGDVSINGFPDVAVYDLLVFPHTPDTIWAGTEIGLFESTDNGTTWHPADNGLPNVCIWAMTHVEDEIVIATHGRGIWSVNIPGMSNVGTYKPLIKKLYQSINGSLLININLRSIYDSSIVKINGSNYQTLAGNNQSLKDTTIHYPVTASGNITAQVVSYKNGNEYASVVKSISVTPLAAAQNSYSSSFNAATNDFVGAGFQIKSYANFSSPAIHTAHPYNDDLNITYTLTIPIIVKSSNAYLRYDEVALIEPGMPGSVFGDDNFWDYVVVEGTKDGINWIPLKDGYDCRLYDEWETAYNLNLSGTEALIRKNSVDLLSTFHSGDVIMIRFRLYADSYTTGWGWMIDNLEIQEIINSVFNSSIPSAFSLKQNYPNPFNPSTSIEFSVPNEERVTITLYDILGKQVAVLVDEQKRGGSYKINLNTASLNLASGTYLYKMKAGGFTEVRKLILLK